MSKEVIAVIMNKRINEHVCVWRLLPMSVICHREFFKLRTEAKIPNHTYTMSFFEEKGSLVIQNLK